MDAAGDLKGRPSWILVRRIISGLGDCLFRGKFHDWPSALSRNNNNNSLISPWGVVVGAEPKSPQKFPTITAAELGRNMADELPVEPSLVLEDTELIDGKNMLLIVDLTLHSSGEMAVHTEEVTVFRLHGENELLSHPGPVWRDDQCYVVRWKYRISRPGIEMIVRS